MEINIDIILLEIEKHIQDAPQVCLQGVEGIKDPFYGTGRIDTFNHKENEFVIPLFDIPYTNSIIKELKMHRTRVIKMPPISCYSYHKDPTKRIHIPLVTNKDCFMVLDDKVYRYPANGNYYIVDTTNQHTFINGSLEERIHLVGCV